MTVADLLSRFPNAKKSGEGWIAKCPAHEDKNPSLSISEGKNYRILLKCHAGCPLDAICSAIGIGKADLFAERNGAFATGAEKAEIVATYDYKDQFGNLVYQVCRMEPKTFRQRRPDGKGGWVWNMEGVERILYRLPEIERDVKRGLPIFICEGEKDCLAMVHRGFSVTCNSGGAGKWQESYSESLRGADCIIIADKDDPGRVHAKQVAESLQVVAKRVRTIELPDLNGRKVKDASDFFAAGGDGGQIQDLVDAIKTLAERTEARLFNIYVKPPNPIPRFFVNGTPICTPGNLTVVAGPPKKAKSAVIGAMMAATMTGDPNTDCLGFASSNRDGKAVLHFDTEQSLADHHAMIERSIRRAGLQEPPAWLRSHCITGFTAADARRCVPLMMEKAAKDFGGIHSVLIDGAGDLVCDVNDAEECNAFVGEHHALAIKYECPMNEVLHFNPGSDFKTRGHLGSQLERKAETNLRLDSDGDAIVLWSEKSRRAPISKDRGPRFIWSDELQMHVSTETRESAKAQADRDKLIELAKAAFEDHPSLSRTDLEATFEKRLKVSASTAYLRAAAMIKSGIIQKSVAGMYVFNGPAE